jgi:arylsulfatase
VRRGQWKLVKKHLGDWELYDMVNDRTELEDVSGQFPDLVEELTALYQDWADRCGVMPWDELLEIKRGNASPYLLLLEDSPLD